MAGILGIDWRQVKALLKAGFADVFRSEWESGISIEQIAEKYDVRNSVVMKVISYDQVYKDFEKI